MNDAERAHLGIALAKAWLHDPPSKALGIQDHEARTRRLLEIVVGADEALRAVEMMKDPDRFAAVTERLPMPTAGSSGERAVGIRDGIRAVHPLSGLARTLDTAQLAVEDEEAAVAAIVGEAGDSAWCRWLALWRCLPERLAQRHADWTALPADSRQPDHTIFHHLDIAAAFEAADAGAALLSFSLGPVQSFIAAARTLRDLWSGSLLLSKLTFEAMRPVLDELGPQAFVYPAPRGVPDVDAWLREQGLSDALVAKPPVDTRLLPAIPNRFVALVPADRADALASGCEQSMRAAWSRIAEAARRRIAEKLGPAEDGWDARWREQIDGYWEVRTSVLQRRSLTDDLRGEILGTLPGRADDVRGLADAIPPDHRYGFGQKHAGRWAADIALAAKVAEAARQVAHFRPDAAPGPAPAKCTLFGELEQMGPPTLEQSAEFWQRARDSLVLDGLRLREGERLSALGLVRRFWPATSLGALVGEEVWAEKTRIADTATVAARLWLRDARIDPGEFRRWNGTWLFEDERSKDEPCPSDVRKCLDQARDRLGERPPKYFAVVHLDGDRLGKWLSGELAPSLAEALHPKMRRYFESVLDRRDLLALPRPLSPARHAALSSALLHYALRCVGPIVDQHAGEVVYAGGDDVLALLPVRTALPCARALRDAFRAEACMGARATMSGGIVIAHHHSSLRGALEAARRAERRAKESGRDALGIAVMRRSGEHAECLAPWDAVADFCALASAFRTERLSDRWAYRLRAELDVLEALPREAFRAEVSRLIARTERAGDTSVALKERVETLLSTYDEWAQPRAVPEIDVRRHFCTLVQSAAFVARGDAR